MERFFEIIRLGLIKEKLWISNRIELILWNIRYVLPLNLFRAHMPHLFPLTLFTVILQLQTPIMLITLYKYYSFRTFDFLHPLEDIQLSFLQLCVLLLSNLTILRPKVFSPKNLKTKTWFHFLLLKASFSSFPRRHSMRFLFLNCPTSMFRFAILIYSKVSVHRSLKSA